MCRRFESCRAHLILPYLRGFAAFLDGHDRRAKERALCDGARLLSSYQVEEGKVWTVTEADRSSTCVLTPSEY